MGEKPYELPERGENSAKGDYGRVLVVGGSHRYTNTPAIVSLGSLRVGTDLVTAAVPGRAASFVPGFALNIVSEPLEGRFLEKGHVETVLALAEDADCLAIGPGIGEEEETQEAVVDILSSCSCNKVVDADAIHAISDDYQVLGKETVVTPHAAEFESLTGESIGEWVDERKEAVKEAASELRSTVVLKGPVDVVSDGKNLETNSTGNPYMTRGGTGDILTGVITGMMAQGVEPFQAALNSARVNGEAGDKALEKYGRGFMLEEMLDELSRLI